MPLGAGSRLGPYEILAPIGAGGMGEVYRARDPRLGRDVAIKVLPASFSNDPDRLKRFEQEARAAGVLNHPHVTIVYDIGQQDGSPYVVQELLEGETLRAELASGRFSPRKSIDYAIQVTRGLAAAHEKGIVHRDLKPENLFVTNDGRVKILDFGLAKLTQVEGSGNATNLPTATEPGVVMGTLGYMSPEQVKAKPADARSDIFALGAILYEMLSGNRAFRGDSAGETMAAILKEDPPELAITNRNISPGLERIVRHCLEKSPERRFQSASDIAFDLEALSGGSGAVVAIPAGRRISRLLWPALALAMLAAGLAAGALWMAGRRPAPPSYQQLTFRRGRISTGRFAPDGQTVVFSGSFDGGPTRLYSLRPGSPQSSPLTLPPAELLSVARSSELAVLVDSGVGQLFTAGSTLARVPMSGGSPRVLLDEVDDADWAPDGESLAVVHTLEGRGRLEFPVGKVLYESTDRVGSLRVSPRGDQVAFVDHPISEETGGSIRLVDRSGKTRMLSDGWFDLGRLAWAPGGTEVWFSASRTGSRRSLWAVDLSGRLRTLVEAPGSIDILDVSPSGKALINQYSWRAFVSGIPPGETAARDFTWFDFTFPSDLSNDGKTLLFQEWGEGGGPKGSVYLRRTDGSPPVHLGEGFAMSLSPDEKWVLARLYTTPPRLVLLPTGAGEPKSVDTEDLLVHWGTFFPDGRRLLLVASKKGENAFYALDLSAGTARRIAPTKTALAARGVNGDLISPDNRFLARRGPANDALLLSLETGEERPMAGVESDEELLRWSEDGHTLFVAARRATANVFSRVDPFTGKREPWKEIQVSGDPVGLRGGTGPLHLSADGKSIFWGYQRYSDELYLVDGVK